MISHSSQSFTNREYVEFIIFVIFGECYFNDKLEWDVKTTPCCTEFLNTGATIRDENGCVRSVLLWDPSVNVNNSNCYSLPKFIKTVLSQLVQGRPQEGVSGWGDHGECGARTYNGGPGAEPLVRGAAESILVIGWYGKNLSKSRGSGDPPCPFLGAPMN